MTTWTIVTESGTFCGHLEAYSPEDAEREAEARGFEVLGTRQYPCDVDEVVVVD